MKAIGLLLLFLSSFVLTAQTALFDHQKSYTRQDSLRGSITPQRAWWDLINYDLYVKVHPDDQTISGNNKVTYQVLSDPLFMQIDLQEPMKIISVSQNDTPLKYTRDGNVFFIEFPSQKIGDIHTLDIQFEGKPRAAKQAPWDGGFSWAKDKNGNHFIATSNQGIGASLWWPCKDHMYDEPDKGLTLSINVPKDLIAVGNGRLEKVKKENDNTKTYTWKVESPINNYGVNINIGDYVNFKDSYQGEKGKLDLSYWVLSYNETKARAQFKEAPRTIEAFEYWFGAYPFYSDSYKLVEVPYLGMEHQSSVTYGNNFQNGYNGRGQSTFDWSGTGWGAKWDYIIVHETGHEWFANNITAKDIADLWIHESFTTYSESLFIEYWFGRDASNEYTIGLRKNIDNRKSLIGDYQVNSEGSKGIYWKGSNMLHTLRQVIDSDTLWRSILRGLNRKFYHKTVTTWDIENYISERSGLNLEPVFHQYLRDIRIPVFEYYTKDNMLVFRWTNCIEGFNMPLKIQVKNQPLLIKPVDQWQKIPISSDDIIIDPNYYIYASKIF